MNQEAYRIQPQGYFDAAQAAEFRTQIKTALETQAELVVFDCQDLLCIDSSGLGELILAYKSLQQANARFVLCAINDQIETLLSLTGMDQIFEAHRDRPF